MYFSTAANAFFLKAIENFFNIDNTPFLKCKQKPNYKLNLLNRIEYKC